MESKYCNKSCSVEMKTLNCHETSVYNAQNQRCGIWNLRIGMKIQIRRYMMIMFGQISAVISSVKDLENSQHFQVKISQNT